MTLKVEYTEFRDFSLSKIFTIGGERPIKFNSTNFVKSVVSSFVTVEGVIEEEYWTILL